MSDTFLHGVQVLEVDDGIRPIRTVRSSVIGLVGTGNNDETAASVTIGNGNAALKFTAKAEQGASGNAIQIAAVNPGTNNASLSVSVSGKVITISLATDGSAAATSTASQVLAAVNASAAAALLVTASLAPSSTGASVYAAHAATSLAGGIDATFPLDTPVLVTAPRNIDATLGADTYLGKALEAIYKQAGAVCVVVRVDDPGADSHDATSATGIYALKRAQADLGYVPRIIVAEYAHDTGVVGHIKSVAESCRAVAIVGLDSESIATSTEATGWVTDNGNERTFAIWPFINGGEDPAPYVAGVLAKSDNERGFWWSPSNVEVFGLTSIDKPVDFQLGDSTCLANILNEGKVTTFIRQGGFRVWGNLTGSIDPKWQFLSVRRTADIINDSILYNHLWAVDRSITRTYLEDVSDGVNAYLATLTNLGAIIGGKCWPDPALNSPDQIALGKVYFNFEFTPPYPAQTVTFRSILTNDYLSELID
jgi:phage tail sheath protein FI